MKELEAICEMAPLTLLKRANDFQETDLVEIMSSNTRNFYDSADLTQAGDLIKRCIQWVPGRRISAADAMNHPFFQ